MRLSSSTARRFSAEGRGCLLYTSRPCDYSKKVNKSTRRLALRRVLGDLIAASKVSTVSECSVADGKTKSFIKAVKDLTDAKKAVSYTHLVLCEGGDG